MNFPPAARPPTPPLIPPRPIANPGKPVLYLPHLIFAGQGALRDEDHPLHRPIDEFPQFPFQRPPGLLPLNGRLHTRLHPLMTSRCVTKGHSHTETASAVDALNSSPGTKLRWIYGCTTFWNNVCKYASPETFVTRVPAAPQAFSHLPAAMNTRNLGNAGVPLPKAERQAEAVKALAGWFLCHENREATMSAMTSEPAVQGEVTMQMTETLNALLKTRYTAMLPPPEDNVLQHSNFPDQGGPQQRQYNFPQPPEDPKYGRQTGFEVPRTQHHALPQYGQLPPQEQFNVPSSQQYRQPSTQGQHGTSQQYMQFPPHRQQAQQAQYVYGLPPQPRQQAYGALQQQQHSRQQVGLRPEDDSPRDDSFPQWARSCYLLHLQKSANSAGWPDFLLRRFDHTRNHAAIGEVKTWWSYDTAFTGMLGKSAIDKDSKEFIWSTKHIAGKLLRQVWGEMIFFGCTFGFVTNGKKVMLVAREPNTMILSEVVQWDHPTVLQALVGLSFASIDIGYLDANARQSFVSEYICPAVHRRTSWWMPQP